MTGSRILLGGCAADLLTRDGLLGAIDAAWSERGVPLAVASANLDHIHHFGRGRLHAGTPQVDRTDLRWLVTLDGMPLVKVANRRTGGSWPRLAGADLIEPILRLAESRGVRLGVLGGTAAAQRAMGAALSARMPGLVVAGMWAPSRAEITDAERAGATARQIAATGVDLLVVGLGKPRQEQWIDRHGLSTGASVLLAFGASMDFLAGRVDRAPAWMQRWGLEWLYRLVAEPRRMWRRYLVEAPGALWQVIRSPGR